MWLYSDKASNYIKNNWKHLQIDLTNKCNTKCKYCVGNFIDRHNSKDISIDLIKQCIDNFKTYSNNPLSIVLNCNAEPTCSNTLEDILMYIDNVFKEKSILVQFDTNGIKLTNKLIDTLNNINNITVKISISCWGYDEDSFGEFHCIDNIKKQFEKYSGNIDKYLSITNNNIKISFSTPYIDDNFLIKTKEWLSKKLKERVLIEVYDGSELLDNYSQIPVMIRVFYDNNMTPLWNTRELPKNNWKTCNYAFDIINISNNGEVFPCISSNRYSNCSIGNIYDNTLWNILNNKKSYDLISKILNNELPFKNCNNICNMQYCNSKIIDKLELS